MASMLNEKQIERHMRTTQLKERLEFLHALLQSPVQQSKARITASLPEEERIKLEKVDKAMREFFELGEEKMLLRKDEHSDEIATIKDVRAKIYADAKAGVTGLSDKDPYWLEVGQAVMRVSMKLTETMESYAGDNLPHVVSQINEMFSTDPYAKVVKLVEQVVRGTGVDDKTFVGVMREVVGAFYSEEAIRAHPFGLSNVDMLGSFVDSL